MDDATSHADPADSVRAHAAVFRPALARPAHRDQRRQVFLACVREARKAKHLKAPLRGALLLAGRCASELLERLTDAAEDAAAGYAPAPIAPFEADLRCEERLAVDYEGALDLSDKLRLARAALVSGPAADWSALRAKGIFRGQGARPRLALLCSGQGTQSVNMLRRLAAREPIVEATFAEADRVLEPVLGRPLRGLIFAEPGDAAATTCAEQALRRVAVMQTAVLTADVALARLLEAYGVQPDAVMGHSLGEYAALVLAGAFTFAGALEVVSARDRELASVSLEDGGRLAAVFAPAGDLERLLRDLDQPVEIANYNSRTQSVIGGPSPAVEAALAVLARAGMRAAPLAVSHAFHTSVLSHACEPWRRSLSRVELHPPRVPVVSNATGDFYPRGSDARSATLDLLARHVAAPVQFTRGLRTLHQAGIRAFVEVGPRRTLHAFVEDELPVDEGVVSLFTNHKRLPDEVAFNHALCGLYALGHGAGRAPGIA